MNRFSLVRPRTITEAAASASTTVADAMATSSAEVAACGDTSVVKAGGIDLLDMLKENLLAPGTLVSLNGIRGLDAIIQEEDGSFRIGALVTLTTLADHHAARQRYPALTDAVRASASLQIRNVATLGGNLLQRPRCWYFRTLEYRCLRKGGDHCFALTGENQYHAIFDNTRCAIVHPSAAATALVALGAKVELTNAEGAVRQVLLEDFFVTPEKDVQRENDLKRHEILTAILLPPLPISLRMAYLKQGQTDSFDWPLADVAVVLNFNEDATCSQASIILGAAAPVPYRAKAAEAVLRGRIIDEDVSREAAHAALEGAMPLSKNGFKLPLFEALIRRSILKAMSHL